MTDRIPIAGVLGAPIAHSRSPRLHAHWLRQCGLRGHYVPIEVESHDLHQVLALMPRMGFVGCNVTLPYKEKALGLADVVTDRAAAIGAANTLVFRGGRIEADNTDGYGFTENLRQNAPSWRAGDGPAVVFGAGGASRAVIVALIDAGVPEIRLTNRTRSRSEALRVEFGPRIVVTDWDSAGEILADARTVVNASALGMTGQPPFPVPLDGLMPGAVVTDLVYSPLDTAFLRSAREFGGIAVDGLGMLIHQAVPGFMRWFGARPVVDDATRAALLAP